MEDKKIEIVLVIAVAIFVVAFIGTAAWWIGHQGTGAIVTGGTGNLTATASTGAAGLFPASDRSMEAEKTQMHGQVTVNGQPPVTEKRTLADGTAYGGIVRINYSQEQKYLPLITGTGSTGGLIDMAGNYTIDDVYKGVPFTATVTLYLKNEKEPLIRQIATDSGSPRQFTVDSPLVQDLDMIG